MIDTFRLKGLRKQLISELKDKGIKDSRILEAFFEIPRHYFIESTFAEWAYKDVPFNIGEDQTISQPYTVAFMTELLEVKPKDKILEVGTGSGFQACLLAYLGAKVYSIERIETLFSKTSALLPKIGFGQIRLFLGDGYDGLPKFAPFDKIIITAGAEVMPKKLLKQLAVGGIAVIPIGKNGSQVMTKVIKKSEDEFDLQEYGDFVFVPMLKGVVNK